MTPISADKKGQTRIALIHTNVQQICANWCNSCLNWVGLELSFYLIAQRRECRTRTSVVNDASPHQVAVQFWQDGRQIFGQPFAFGGRQCLDGSFNFGNCAHASGKLLRRACPVKRFQEPKKRAGNNPAHNGSSALSLTGC